MDVLLNNILIEHIADPQLLPNQQIGIHLTKLAGCIIYSSIIFFDKPSCSNICIKQTRRQNCSNRRTEQQQEQKL